MSGRSSRFANRFALRTTRSFVTAAAVLLACAATALADGYTRTTFSGGYTALTSDTTVYDGSTSTYDDDATSVSLGFTFDFYGNPYTSCYVSSNGFITFASAGDTEYVNEAIADTAAPNAYIALCWDDLIVEDNGTTDRISYKTTGSAGERVFTVQFSSVSVLADEDGEITGQIKLYEGSNRVEIVYGSANDWSGVGATIGVEDSGGNSGQGGPSTAADISTVPTTSYRFAPVTTTVSGTLQYQDKTYTTSGFTGGTTYKSAPFVQIELYDDVTDVLLDDTTSSSTGLFTLSVPASPRDLRLEFHADAGVLDVRSSPTADPYSSEFDVDAASTTVTLGNVRHTIANTPSMNAALNIIDTMIAGYDYAADRTVESGLAAITVIWSSGNTDGTYYTGTRVYLVGQTSDSDEYDDDVILHEYGHHVMNALSTDSSPGGSHSWATVSSRTLAWSEGWATYFEAAVQDHATYVDTYSTTAYTENLEPPTGDPTGPRVEGAIAGILWDIRDPDNEVHDYAVGSGGGLGTGEDKLFEVMDVYMDGLTGNDIDVFLDGWEARGFAPETITSLYIERGIHTDDGTEPNDTFGSGTTPRGATTFPTGQTSITGEQITLWNDDFFAIPVDDSGLDVQVLLEFVHAQGNLDLEILDADGEVLETSTTSTDDEVIRLIEPDEGTYYARVYGHDGATNDDYAISYSLPVTITTTTLEQTTATLPYSVDLQQTGGVPEVTWSVAGGALPPGMTLSSAGRLAGTPTAGGTFEFTVAVVDGPERSTDTQVLSMLVYAAPNVVSGSVHPWTVGRPYEALIEAEGGRPPLAFSIVSGNLPDGVSATTVGGTAIRGTPTESGTFPVRLRLEDANGAFDDHVFTFSVNATPSMSGAVLPDWTVGHPYGGTIARTGGTGPFEWDVTSGSLPPGLRLLDNGAIVGTATAAGSSTFGVTVVDQAGATGTGSFTVSINDSIAVSTVTLPEWTHGIDFDRTAEHSGGTGAVAWEMTDGTLPAGITFADDGRLTGTPTATGDFDFTIAVTDAVGAAATEEVSWRVNAPCGIDTASLPDWTLDFPYDETVARVGGTAPFTWSVQSGTLPTGVTSDAATGRLVGTPTAAGSFSFELHVTDARGSDDVRAFAVRINAQPTIAQPAGIIVPRMRDAVRQVALVSGTGTPPLAWSVSAGALPSGYTLDPDTGEIVGRTDVPGMHPITLQVSDRAGAVTTLDQVVHVAEPLPPKAKTAFDLAGAASVGYWYFDALAGTKVNLKAKYAKGATAAPRLRLQDAAGVDRPLGATLREKTKSSQVKKWIVPEAGRVFVRVDASESTTGASGSLKLALTPAKKWRVGGPASLDGETFSIPFSAPKGSVLKAKIKSQGKPGLLLRLDRVLGPGGGELRTADFVKDGGKTLSLKGVVLPVGGLYTLIFRSDEGAPGAWSAKLGLKIPKTWVYVHGE